VQTDNEEMEKLCACRECFCMCVCVCVCVCVGASMYVFRRVHVCFRRKYVYIYFSLVINIYMYVCMYVCVGWEGADRVRLLYLAFEYLPSGRENKQSNLFHFMETAAIQSGCGSNLRAPSCYLILVCAPIWRVIVLEGCE
jgi:hypothetical protein